MSNIHTLITTTRKACDQARILSKVLNHIIPNAKYLNRGKTSISELIIRAENDSVQNIILVGCRNNEVDQLNFYDRTDKGYEHNPYFIKIYEFIDPKIFNQRMKVQGPLSTSLETRNENRELMNLLEKYFKIEFTKKNRLWLMIDKKERADFIQFVDSTTMKRFVMLRLQVKKRT